MSGLTLATCDNALPPGGTAPEWVHLLPAGNMQGRKARPLGKGMACRHAALAGPFHRPYRPHLAGIRHIGSQHAEGQEGMSDVFDRARALINQAASHPDPEAAMEAIEAEASPEDQHMFPLLWEGLTLALNGATPEDADAL